MKPSGYVLSVLVLPSIFTKRCIRMEFTSLYVNAYLRRLRRTSASGRHSRCLCGPGDGLGAKIPPSLSSIQCFGALSLFKCFVGPRLPMLAYAFGFASLLRFGNGLYYFDDS